MSEVIRPGEPYPEEMEDLGMEKESIEFSAYLPPIQSAISVGADGARVKLDVPESEKAEFLKLQAYGFGKRLRVTVEIEEETS